MLLLRDRVKVFCQDGLHHVQNAAHPFYSKGCKAPTVNKFFAAENLCSVATALQRCLRIQPASGRPSKVAHEAKDLIKQQMVSEA